MFLSQHIAVTTKRDDEMGYINIVLTVRGDNVVIACIASSFDDILTSSVPSQAVSFGVRSGTSGIMILALAMGGGYRCFLITIDGSKEKPIDLDGVFVPLSGRAYELNSYSFRVCVRGVMYAFETVYDGHLPSSCISMNSVLLCKYVHGDVSDDDVAQAGQELIHEKEGERKLEQLVSDLEAAVALYSKEHARFVDDALAFKEKLCDVMSELSIARVTLASPRVLIIRAVRLMWGNVKQYLRLA